ncbi:MAG: phosphoenolpyruvate--protein phosphotransferase, partial [Blautia sp.]|nr:phosphoenolpyruvate--protein phosphotransferase [Blautia sp.]
EYLINNVLKELDDFSKARSKVLAQMQDRYEDSPADSDTAKKYGRQMNLMGKGSFQRAVETMIVNEKVSAAYAIMTTSNELTNTFRKLEDPSIVDRITDVQEIAEALISVLGGVSSKINLGDSPVILVAEQLLPSEILEMDKEKILSILTHTGSHISHASIVAKTMGIPSLSDLEISPEWNNHCAIVDGYSGTVYLDPEDGLLREYKNRQEAEAKEKETLLKLRDAKDVTRDGKKVLLCANIGNLDDLNSVTYYGAGGIGLLRSEFQYLGRENYPRENELYRAYCKVAEEMGNKLAVIRTADLGADKKAAYMNIPAEQNPMMGNRGIRLSLDWDRMFKAQLRAIYRASIYGNLAIMFPMITSVEEIIQIFEMIGEVKENLRQKNIPFKEIKTGITIETPAAVMISEELAEYVDFLSIGTNDLTQYTLAMDRQNPFLAEKYNENHPAVMKMIQMVIDAGHKKGCKVGISGELAGDTTLTEQFLKMGVDVLSVVPASILMVRKAILETDLGTMQLEDETTELEEESQR